MADPLAAFLDRHGAVVRVRILRVRGSSPRAAGTEMAVARDAVHGTIGGGQFEYMAIDAARALIASGGVSRLLDIPLGPEIGQCCGGRVEVALDLMDRAHRAAALDRAAAERMARPAIVVLGAGHVGRALAGCLALLPVRTRLVDQRAGELARATPAVSRCHTPLPEAEIRAAPPGAAFIVLTHDHALDFLLAAEALSRPDAAYVGLIGSATKRARFRAWAARAHPGLDTARLTCPIGAAGGADKRPEVIAAFAAAEIMAALAPAPAPAAAPRI